MSPMYKDCKELSLTIAPCIADTPDVCHDNHEHLVRHEHYYQANKPPNNFATPSDNRGAFYPTSSPQSQVYMPGTLLAPAIDHPEASHAQMRRLSDYSHPSPTHSTQVLHLHCFLLCFIFTQTHLHFQVFSHQRKRRQGKTQDLEDHKVQPVSYLRANHIEEILWRSLSKISHKFLTWHDMSSKWKYPFQSKSHIISHNLHFHLDKINENIF